MVHNRNNKNKKGSPAAASTNGVAHTNGCHQKNGIRESEDERNANIVFTKLGATANASQEDSSNIRTAHEPTTSFSVESQTESSAPTCCKKSSPEDGLIIFSKLSLWSRIETLCEIAKILSPEEVRLLGACLEGSARPAVNQFRGVELNANNANFVSRCTESALWTYPDAVKETFNMLCLLGSTNRQCAFAYVKLIDRLMNDRHRNLTMLPEKIRLETYETLGSLVTAAVHHPAFAVDQCMRLASARDELLREYDQVRQVPTAVTSTPGSYIYIKRINTFAPKDSEGHFSIELHWSDGQVTWANRTKKDIAALHRRLLDAFGDERREETSNASDAVCPAPQQQAAAASATTPYRILPYFKQEMSESEVIDYVDGLSDLPARMMLSSVICEEFYVSRQKTAEKVSGSGYSTRASPVPSFSMPLTTPSSFYLATMPLSYRSNFDERMQVSKPTCSNCAGDHTFMTCPERSFQEVVQNGKEGFRLKLGAGVTGTGGSSTMSDDVESHSSRHVVSPSFIAMPPGLPAAYVYNPHLEPVLARIMQQQPYPMPGGHPAQQ